MSDLLFVYGTLMRAARHPMRHHIAAHADYVTDATFRGRLYLVHHYPGVVDSSEPEDLVYGELYLVRSRVAFADLDDYEGCGPDTPQPAEYIRVQRSMTCADGAVVTAWIYLYNWPTEHLPRVPGGRFIPPHFP